jgi:Predicted transcriptional regulators
MIEKPNESSTTPTNNTNDNANTKERPAAEPENDFGDRLPIKWEIENIPLDQLEIDEQHFEREVKQAEIEVMAESMRELGGVIHPLTVRPIMGKPGHFGIISGRERFQAAQLIGLKTLSCRVHEDCSDEQARKISIHENLTRSSLTPDERNRGLAELVKIHEAEQLQQRKELGPTAAPSKKRGRPINAAVRKAAAEAKVSTRTVQIAVKADRERTRKTMAGSTAAEMDTTKTVTSPATKDPAGDNAEQGFKRIARKADHFRVEIDTFLKSIGDSAPDVLANVDLHDVALLFLLVPVWKTLFTRIPKDLRLKAKRELVVAHTPPTAEVSTPKASDQPTAPATSFSQLLLGPLPAEAPGEATSDATPA